MTDKTFWRYKTANPNPSDGLLSNGITVEALVILGTTKNTATRYGR